MTTFLLAEDYLPRSVAFIAEAFDSAAYDYNSSGCDAFGSAGCYEICA